MIGSSHFLRPVLENDTPRTSDVPNPRAKEAQRDGQRQNCNVHACLRAVRVDIAGLRHPGHDSVQEPKCHDVLEAVDKHECIRCDRKVTVGHVSHCDNRDGSQADSDHSVPKD